MVTSLLLLVHLLPLILVLFLCMRARPPRPKTPSKKKKVPTPPIPPRPSQTLPSGNQPGAGGSLRKKNNEGEAGGGPADGKPTVPAPVAVSAYLPNVPSPDKRADSASPNEEKNALKKSTSCSDEKKPGAPGAASTPAPPTPRQQTPARSRHPRSRKSREGRKSWEDRTTDLRTCADPTVHSVEEMTCDMGRTRGSCRSIRSRVEQVKYEDFTAISREDRSMVTCRSEYDFDQKREHVMGNVDEEIDSDWEEYLGERLETDVEESCLQPTEEDASAVICGHYRIWLANKVGSQCDPPPDPPQQTQ